MPLRQYKNDDRPATVPNKEVLLPCHAASQKPTQPWLSRGLNGLARVFYKDTDETEVFITAGSLSLGNVNSSRAPEMRIKIPKIPIVKNVLTVALPHSGFGIALSRQAPVQQAESPPSDVKACKVGANLRSAAPLPPAPCNVPLHGKRPPGDDCSDHNDNQNDIDGTLCHGHIDDENHVPDDSGGVQLTEELPTPEISQNENSDPKVVAEAPSVLESTIDKISTEKVLFDVPSEPVLEDVDEYVGQLEAFKQNSKSQPQGEGEANQALKSANDTIARFESRIYELSSSKNDLRAQRDEANHRVKQLEAFLAALNPGRTRASIHKNIKDLTERLEISQKETEIECDAKTKLEDKVKGLKDEIEQIEDKRIKDIKNESKLRVAAKEPLVEQHEAEVKDLRVQHQMKLDALSGQYENEINNWQQIVAGYQNLGKELYDRLKQVETSLLGHSYPTTWRKTGKIFAKIASTRDRVLKDGFFKELHEKAHELFPQIFEPQDDDERAEPIVIDERYDDGIDEDDVGEASVAHSETPVCDFEDYVDEEGTDDGWTTEEDEKSPRTRSEAEAPSTSASTIDEESETLYSPLFPSGYWSNEGIDGNGFSPQAKPSFDFSTEIPPAFKFGSSSPEEANSTGALPPDFSFGSGTPVAMTFEAHQRARSPQEGPSSASEPSPIINSFKDSHFPIFAADSRAPSNQEGASSSRPSHETCDPKHRSFVNPFEDSHFPIFEADNRADSLREDEAFGSPPAIKTAPIPSLFAHPFADTAFPTFGANTGSQPRQEGEPSASQSAEQRPTRPPRQAFNPYAHVQSQENFETNTADQLEQNQAAPESPNAWAPANNGGSDFEAGCGSPLNRSAAGTNASLTDFDFSASMGTDSLIFGTGAGVPPSTPVCKGKKLAKNRKKR